ncbi:MAG TPA: choice-of-anchor D domain-containing protein [Solirubrobacteraceae bacterium]|nr:choice-of-anchor D domain-containing protein [Solirubrobacteraceae bacterium]
MPRSRRSRWALACLGLLASGLAIAALALAAGSLSASRDTIDFGERNIDDGASGLEATTITNAGPDPVAINHLSLSGLDTDQFVVDLQPGDCDGSTVLADDQSCDVHVYFNPTGTGSKSATLNIVPDPGDASVEIALAGTGTDRVLTAAPDTLPFGSQDIADGATAAQTSAVQNTGTETVDVAAVTVGGADPAHFNQLTNLSSDCTAATTLTAGQSCNVRVEFDPATTGGKAATVTVDSNAPADETIALSGTGTQAVLTADPDSLSFGSRDVDGGATTGQTSVIENTGTATANFTGITVDAGWERLTGAAGDCATNEALAVGDECNLRIAFDPTLTGPQNGNATIGSNAADETIALSGTGTQTELSRSPATLPFGSQDVNGGATVAQESTITNSGTEPVSIVAVNASGDTTQFQRLTALGTDCTTTTTLTAGQTCEVRVAFDPTTTGAKSATYTVDSNADDVSVGATGTGTLKELTAAPDSLPFGSKDVDDGATAAESSTVTNSGTETVTVTAVTVGGAHAADFTRVTDANDCAAGAELDPTETCIVRATFNPSGTGSRTATVTIDSDALDETIALSGTGTQTELSRSPATLPFGSHDVNEGATATQESTVTNSGTEPVSVVAVNASGDTTQFQRLTGLGTDCTDTTTLTAGETCEVRVAFDPTTTGAKSATYTVDSNADDVSVDATGTGTLKQLTPVPATLPFGSRDVDTGPTAAQTSTVANTGDQPVTIAAVTLGGANPSQFQRLTGDPDDCAPATTLQPLEDCTVRAVFDPSFKGAKSATVTVDSNAPDASVALTGTGIESVYESSDDPLDEGHVTNGQVNAVAFDAAGRTYLGGTFTHVGPRTGHGVKLSESSDEPASGFPDVNGAIRAVVADGSGGWFIGGDFTSVGGVPRSRLAHILSSGAVDSAWDPSADGRVNALAVSGSALFVGGEFAEIDGVERAFLAKLTSAGGAVDPDWDPIVNNRVWALAVGGTALHVGGEFTQVGGEARNRLARVSTVSGDTDLLWDPDVNGIVSAIAVSGTDVFVGGGFTEVGGEDRDRLAKVTGVAGDPDLAWDPNANNTVSTLALDGNDLYAGGAFTTIGGEPRNRAAKLSATSGAVDGAFDPNANAAVHALAVSAAGVYVAGDFTQIGGQSRSRLARVASGNGAADGWDPAANGAARALALNGTDVYAGGDFTSVGATARNRLARLEPDGTLDTDWNPDANGTVSALVVSGSDVYVGGLFTSVGGQARDRIAKLSTSSSTADLAWNPGASGTVSALAVSGTTVYAGGLFLTIDGESRSRLAKLTGASGDLDTGWLPAGANGQVSALALSGPDLFAGGAFTTIGGVSRARIAKLDAGGVGGIDSGWDPGASGTVSALAVDGTDLYAGGFFTTIGEQPRNFAAQLDTGVATVDPSWNPNPNSIVRAIVLSATDVYVGGDFTQVSDHPHNRLAQLSQTGTGAADAGWDPEVTGGNVHALALSGDRLAAGGSFTAVGGQSSQGFALLELPTLTTAPGGLAFGEREVAAGPTAELESTITNPRAESITFTAVSLGGPDASQFERLTGDPDDCTASTVLDQNETCTVRARFDPTSAGAKSASVSIVSNSPGVDVALTGTGSATQLSADPASLPFGGKDVDDGATAIQTSTVTNSGTEQIDFVSVTVGGANASDFARLTGESADCTATTILQTGQTCELRVEFDPGTTGAKAASVTIDSNADDLVVALSGAGTQTQLTRSPASLAFGPHDVDDAPTAAQESTVTNSGTETVTLTGVATTGDADQFVRLTDAVATDCASGTELDAGETCKVRERFDPTTVGVKSATVTVTSNAVAITIGLSGTGTQTQLTAEPDSLTFDPKDVDDGATAPQESIVTNSGTEAVTVAAVDVTGDSADFVRLTDEDSDCSTGDVLAAGQTCKVRVESDPATVGDKTATVTIDSNAPDETVALSGRGIETELSRSPASLPFGARDIDDGPTAAQESTVTNSGTETVDLDAVTFGGANADQFAQLTGEGTDCTAATTLTAGQTCKLRLRFDPTATGEKAASVTVESNADDVAVTLSGTGTQTLLTRSPDTLPFGNQNINDGPTAAQESTVTNAGSESVTFTAIDLTGDTTQFERLTGQPSDCTASTTLTAGETCKLRARFDPTTTGLKSATLTVDSNAADVSVALTGTGVLTQLQRSAASLAFGTKDIDDGPTAAQESTITNSGSETVTVSAIDFTGDTTQFERLTGQPTDCSAATVLTAGQTCKVRARFDPTTTGAKSATITAESNAADQEVALTGTGIQTLLTRSPGTLPFGPHDIDDPPTATQTSTVTNAGTETVDLDAVDVTGDAGHFERLTTQGSDCTAATTLTAGQTCEVRVRFDPTTVGAKTATVTVESNLADDVTLALSGTGTQTLLAADPDTFAFGAKDVDDGATDGQTSVIENTGTEPVTFTGITVDAGWVRLTGSAGDCATTEALAAGAECNLRVAFDPSATGVQNGSATIDSNAPDETVALSGTGIQTLLSRDPATVPLGSQDVNEGPTAAQESTVTNSGTEPVSIVAVNESGDGDEEFERLTGAVGDCSSTTTLTAGQTCKVRVRFDPVTQGAASATYTVDSNAADVAVDVSGTGTLKELSAGDAALAFGAKDIDDGATDIQPSTVENTGDQTITIVSVAVAGDTAHFERLTDDADDCTAGDVLAPLESCDVRARFDPTSVGVKSATVTIDSNAPDETVTLGGTGTQTLLTRAPDSLTFGSLDIDDPPTATQTSTVTNAGTETVDLDAVTLGGADPTHFGQVTGQAGDCTAATTLTAGQTCELRLRFDPSTMGAKAATATVESNAADVSVTLAGTGIQTLLTRAPDSLAFGSLDIDDPPTATQTSTVTNSGSEPVDLDGVAVTGDDAHFQRLTSEATDCTAATTLTAGQTCAVRVRFDPSTTGVKAATVTVDSNAADVTVALSGTGTQTLLGRAPDTLSFGARDIDDGPTDAQTSTVTNTGSETVDLDGVAVTGDDAHFQRLTSEATDCTATTTLAAGQTCAVRVRFDPSTTGVKAATVTVDSNAADVTVALSGTGTQTLLSRSPDTLAFGPHDIDDAPTSVQTSTVTNAGSEPVDLVGVDLTGDGAQFERLTSAPADCTGATVLTAGQTCDVRVRFDPSTTGAKAATATVDSDAADVAVALSGTGTQTLLTRSPATLPLGAKDIDDGATATQTATVTNAGSEPVDLEAVALTGDTGHFDHVIGAAGDCSAATVLTAGQTCDVRLRFDPDTTGAKSLTATVGSNAADVTVAATGTGTQTQLSRVPGALTFGSRDIDDGPTATQSSTVTNTGTEPVTIGAVAVSGHDDQFERLTSLASDCDTSDTLTAGQTCTLRLRFDPTTMGAKSATVAVSSNAPATELDLTGTGIQTLLSASPASLSHGGRDVDDGPGPATQSTVTNVGSETVNLDAVSLAGANADQFSRLTTEASDCSASTTLAAGETCNLRVRFDPGTIGAKAATATVVSNAPNLAVALSGTGTQTSLGRSPSSLAFGSRDIDDGATATQAATVTNTGTESVNVTGLETTGQFQRVGGAAGDCEATTTLAVGQTCELRVRFDPSSTGAKTGTITVHSNAPDASVSLSGTGTQTEVAATPAALSFGSREVDDGPGAAQTSTVTNTGSEPVDLGSVTVGGPGAAQFERLTGQAGDCASTTTLTAGGTCAVRVRFDPSSRGAKAATVTVTSNLPDVSIALSGTGIDTELSVAPASLAFGARDIDDGASAAQESTVTNTGTQTVTVSAASFTQGGGSFTAGTGAADDCAAGTSLAPDETCKARVRFDPSTVGPKAGTFEIASNAPVLEVALSGTGTQTAITRTPAGLAFGSQDIDSGPTAAQPATIANSGTEPVTLSSVTVTGPDAERFERLTGQATDCAAGTILAPGQTCAVRARFDPIATGARTAALSVDAAAPAADVSVVLSGTGVQAELSRLPADLGFGAQDVDDGPTPAQSATIANTGSEPVGIAGVSVSGDAGDFERLTGEGSDCDAGRTLAAGESCAVRLRFDPAITGAKAATVTVDSNAEDVSVALGGTGIQTGLAFTPAPLAFGARNLAEGPTPAQPSVVRNTGSEPVTVGAATLSGDAAAHFLTQGGLPSDCAAGRTLGAGEECAVRTAFDPSSIGDKAATLTVASTAGPVSRALTGTGTMIRLVLGSGPARASQTARRVFRVQLSALGGTVPRVTLTLSRASGGRIRRMVVTNVSSRRTVAIRLSRALRRGRYKVTANAPLAAQVGAATRTYRLR